MRAVLGQMSNSRGVIVSPREMHDDLRTALAPPMTTCGLSGITPGKERLKPRRGTVPDGVTRA
jgi:hypothetical protein